MDTSVTIIGLVLTFIIAIPLFYVIRSNSINKTKIKTIKTKFSQNNCFNFESLTETQNKKVLALDEKNKGFLLIDFSAKEEVVSFVDLSTIQTCKLVPTTENNSDTILKIEFEFQYKETKKAEYISFYKIENDQIGQLCLYEDHQLAKKWTKMIQDCITL
ncbi:hypothetical protein ACNQF7_12135 [Flavobacterium sp. RSP29]|uniref:hypothetical protein n=1 Tax=Flavobacterium sp. RSP29 TaxID=3401731 RepID=UPI003AAE0E3F